MANVNNRDTRWGKEVYHVKALSILVRMVCLVHERATCIISAERVDRRITAIDSHLGTIILYRKWGGESMAGHGCSTGMARWRAKNGREFSERCFDPDDNRARLGSSREPASGIAAIRGINSLENIRTAEFHTNR